MTATAIAHLLAPRCAEVAALLLPNGKRNGSQWIVGSVHGEVGNSLKVQLSGEKAGVWSDWADQTKGDLIGLWQQARGVNLHDACEEALKFLGITDTAPNIRGVSAKAAPKVFVTPNTSQLEPLAGEALDYLVLTRRLKLSVLDAYGVKCLPGAEPDGPAICFPCPKPDGTPALLKYLAVRRKPDPEKPGKLVKKLWSNADAEDQIFGIRAIPADSRSLDMTEGEIDALSLAGEGFPAVSLPRGVKALAWIDHCWDWLARFDRINLWFDADPEGQRCVDEVATRLGPARCWRVKTPHKDANACLLAGFKRADFLACLNAALGFDPASLKGSDYYADKTIARALGTLLEAPGTPSPWPIPFRVRDGELTIISGFSGGGKSLVWSHLIAQDLAAGQTCCIASLEIEPDKTLAVLTRQLLGLTPRNETQWQEGFRWMSGKVWLVEPDTLGTAASNDQMFAAFDYAARRYGVKRFVVDSLLFCVDGEDDYNAQKNFVKRCKVFAATHACHLYLVCHSKKKEDEGDVPEKFDVRGGAGITDMAFNGFTVWRNYAKTKALAAAHGANAELKVAAEKLPDGKIVFWKQRETGELPILAVWLHFDSGQFHHQPGQYGIRYAKTTP